MKVASKINIRVDTIILVLMALISLEINLPYSLDQLNFHQAMASMGPFSRIFCPGGATNPLVLMGNQFMPYLLMVRTLTVFLIAVWLLLDIFKSKLKLRPVIIFILLLSHVVAPQLMLVAARVSTANHALAHDGGTIQMEESMKMVLAGQNPYKNTFHGTPLENWRGFTNNVIYHVPYMPGAFLYSIPFYAMIQGVFGQYDQRLFYLLLYLGSLLCIGLICPTTVARQASWLMFGLNPFFVKYFLLGANDIVIFFGLLAALWCFKTERRAAGFIMLAMACAVKQFAWFFVPFLLVSCLSLEIDKPKTWLPELRKSWLVWVPAVLVFLLTVIPFFIASPSHFLDDTFLYGSGGLVTSYPMQGFHGYGFASVLLFLKIVPDGNARFPFIFLQLAVVVPLCIALLRRYRDKMDLSHAVYCSSVLLLTFMFFSRYLHGNFIGFIMFWPVFAWTFDQQERQF